eukprot:Rmarinus@m.14171
MGSHCSVTWSTCNRAPGVSFAPCSKSCSSAGGRGWLAAASTSARWSPGACGTARLPSGSSGASLSRSSSGSRRRTSYSTVSMTLTRTTWASLCASPRWAGRCTSTCT